MYFCILSSCSPNSGWASHGSATFPSILWKNDAAKEKDWKWAKTVRGAVYAHMPAYFKCLAVASPLLLCCFWQMCGQVCNTLHLALRFQRCTRIDLHGACDIADEQGISRSDRWGIQFLSSLQQPSATTLTRILHHKFLVGSENIWKYGTNICSPQSKHWQSQKDKFDAVIQDGHSKHLRSHQPQVSQM